MFGTSSGKELVFGKNETFFLGGLYNFVLKSYAVIATTSVGGSPHNMANKKIDEQYFQVTVPIRNTHNIFKHILVGGN